MAHGNDIAIILFLKAGFIAQHLSDTVKCFELCIKHLKSERAK